ncbi:preprotein translocase subunit YajC [Actinomycetaceae bacterium MB13-C1-2]|nr:preprotein translocase subunit YajC [Actinomycetaceae bacterium MB13-C1-2]
MGIEFIIMLVLLMGGLFLMNSFAKRSQQKQKAEREKMMNEAMVAGAWVQTFSGFFGRFIDVDGDVVILETPSGEETYWLQAAIKGVIDPPFEAVLDEELAANEVTSSADDAGIEQSVATDEAPSDTADIDAAFLELTQDDGSEDSEEKTEK